MKILLYVRHCARFFLFFTGFFLSQSYAQELSSVRKEIDVISFNVLAPCWASPTHYTPAVAPYLDRVSRRQHIIDFLNSVADKADIIALQETTQVEFNYFKQALAAKFFAFQVYHDSQYWSSWITPDVPWEPNGVAIFIKKSSFTNVSFRDLALTQDGNHAAYFEGIQQRTGMTVRAASVHLDNDSAANRPRELKSLMGVMKLDTTSRDIIAGDFNYDTQSGALKNILLKNRFSDALFALHHDEPTHPFDVDGGRNSEILDHVVIRNLIPLAGHVFNFNLWKRYPHDENSRVIENLKISGSDHFPITAVAD